MNEKEKLEALDKTLAFLQEKDIKEVSQTTRIAINKLEAIYQKKFDTLQRVHAMGFLQILQKEYQVDLSHWMVEYDKHFFAKSSPELDNTHTTKPQEPQTPLSSPFLDSSRVKDPAEIPSFEPEKTPKWYFILLREIFFHL
ncbi:hypothetical protein [Helicobacter bizzozeronii]|uniref:hypothetical protein n=1 Tax=Helicobacter bizzozeronii TaxID=56877 RepID=UPI001B32EE78|nr:hypothetical protein [Helicobacter bizzozeronii]